jgi:hypothetical protein
MLIAFEESLSERAHTIPDQLGWLLPALHGVLPRTACWSTL